MHIHLYYINLLFFLNLHSSRIFFEDFIQYFLLSFQAIPQLDIAKQISSITQLINAINITSNSYNIYLHRFLRSFFTLFLFLNSFIILILPRRFKRTLQSFSARCRVNRGREVEQSIAIYRNSPGAEVRSACAAPVLPRLAGDDVMQSPLSLWYHLRAFLQFTPITRAA